ncbi:MAG: hypothetical protein ACKVOM_05315 [Ferruginibacter sp.]
MPTAAVYNTLRVINCCKVYYCLAASGRAFRYYSGTDPTHKTLTGVAAAIPHAGLRNNGCVIIER